MPSHSLSEPFGASVLLLALAGCNAAAPRRPEVQVRPHVETGASSAKTVEHVQVSVCDDTGHAEAGTANELCCRRVVSPVPLARDITLDRDVHLRVAHGERGCDLPADVTPTLREQSLSPSEPIRPANTVMELSWP